MMLSAIFCGIVSAIFWSRSGPHDWMALAAADSLRSSRRDGHVTGPLGKAGVWWVWDARLTMSLLMWMVFVSYLLLRRYGGAGSETLAAGLALFGMATAPFVYISVNIWRTIHPLTSVVPTLPVDFAFALWYSFAGFLLLYIALMMLRMSIEQQRAMLDHLYLESEE
jgi:heme exporter protein C